MTALLGKDLLNVVLSRKCDTPRCDFIKKLVKDPRITGAMTAMLQKISETCPAGLNTFVKDPRLGDLFYILNRWHTVGPEKQGVVSGFLETMLTSDTMKGVGDSYGKINERIRTMYGMVPDAKFTEQKPAHGGESYQGQPTPSDTGIRHETQKRGDALVVSNLDPQNSKGLLEPEVHPDALMDTQALPIQVSIRDAMDDLSSAQPKKGMSFSTTMKPDSVQTDQKQMATAPTSRTSGDKDPPMWQKRKAITAIEGGEDNSLAANDPEPQTKKSRSEVMAIAAEAVAGDSDQNSHEGLAQTNITQTMQSGIGTGGYHGPGGQPGVVNLSERADQYPANPHPVLQPEQKTFDPRMGGWHTGKEINDFYAAEEAKQKFIASAAKKFTGATTEELSAFHDSVKHWHEENKKFVQLKGNKEGERSFLQHLLGPHENASYQGSGIYGPHIAPKSGFHKWLNDTIFSSHKWAEFVKDKTFDVKGLNALLKKAKLNGRLPEDLFTVPDFNNEEAMRQWMTKVAADLINLGYFALDAAAIKKSGGWFIVGKALWEGLKKDAKEAFNKKQEKSDVKPTVEPTPAPAPGSTPSGDSHPPSNAEIIQAMSARPRMSERMARDMTGFIWEQSIKEHWLWDWEEGVQGLDDPIVKKRKDARQRLGDWGLHGENLSIQDKTIIGELSHHDSSVEIAYRYLNLPKAIRDNLEKNYWSWTTDNIFGSKKERIKRFEESVNYQHEKESKQNPAPTTAPKEELGLKHQRHLMDFRDDEAGNPSTGIFGSFITTGGYKVPTFGPGKHPIDKKTPKTDEKKTTPSDTKVDTKVERKLRGDNVLLPEGNGIYPAPDDINYDERERQAHQRRIHQEPEEAEPPYTQPNPGVAKVVAQPSPTTGTNAEETKTDAKLIDQNEEVADPYANRTRLAQKLVKVDEPGGFGGWGGGEHGEDTFPTLRPSFTADGADVVLEINQNSRQKLMNKLQWQAFKNYGWEANDESDNPLHFMNYVDEARRFHGELDKDDLLKEQCEEAIELSYSTNADVAQLPREVMLEGDPFALDTRGGAPLTVLTPDETDCEFHDIYPPLLIELPDDHPLKQFTQILGSQIPDSMLKNANRVTGNDWPTAGLENQYIVNTLE